MDNPPRTWMGRSRMRATPSSTNLPRPAAATAAVSGRIAVPALPRNSSAPSTAGNEQAGQGGWRAGGVGKPAWQRRPHVQQQWRQRQQERCSGWPRQQLRCPAAQGSKQERAPGKRPPQPVTTRREAAQSSCSCTPSTLRASTMYRMSSESCQTHGLVHCDQRG